MHPLLSGLYTTVADGGFGPDYKLLGLLDRSTSDLGRTAVDEYVAFRQADPEDPGWFWPEGVLPVLHWGCGMYACVECRCEDGTVLMFEPNGIEDWTQAWYVDAPGVAVWLERWLDGSGWYEEDTTTRIETCHGGRRHELDADEVRTVRDTVERPRRPPDLVEIGAGRRAACVLLPAAP